MNNLLGKPMWEDYGRRAYLENAEIKRDIKALSEKLDALMGYFGLKFVKDDYGEVFVIKNKDLGGEE